jgi:4a-hydroxytetrahydrobiopterin dehydratase
MLQSIAIYVLTFCFTSLHHLLIIFSSIQMARPQKLSPEAVQTHLQQSDGWTLNAHSLSSIERTFTTTNFVSALGFINAVGVLAETADHHPDILLHGWNKVTITLSTHDQGGLTELDFALAAKIDTVRF